MENKFLNVMYVVYFFVFDVAHMISRALLIDLFLFFSCLGHSIKNQVVPREIDLVFNGVFCSRA